MADKTEQIKAELAAKYRRLKECRKELDRQYRLIKEMERYDTLTEADMMDERRSSTDYVGKRVHVVPSEWTLRENRRIIDRLNETIAYLEKELGIR